LLAILLAFLSCALSQRAGFCESSFRAISQDYFANEAPRHFVHEAALFFMTMMTVAVALLDASSALLEVVRI
jgi:hypothetical protein